VIALFWKCLPFLEYGCARRPLKPTALLVTSSKWVPTARLGIALAQTGFAVDAVCPAAHPITYTSALRTAYRYSGLTGSSSISRSISASKPDLVIPCDDLASFQLRQIYALEEKREGSESELCTVLARSLGSPRHYSMLYERATFIEMASREGVRVPKMTLVRSLDEMRKWATNVGLPIVLKSDCSSGGEGVRVVHTMSDADRAFNKLHAPPMFARAAKRALIDGDNTGVWPSILRTRSIVSAQEFISGYEATSLIASWNGTVLAENHFEVLGKVSPSGPASVLRRVDNYEMSEAVAKMARRLNLSGLNGFDFMIEAATKKAYLIEINPRTTQVGHLALGPGCDLLAALYAAVTGNLVQPAPKVTENDVIALFPAEWNRDPNSDFIKTGFHDVPWTEPELIRSCLKKKKQVAAWEAQQTQTQALPSIQVSPTK
jgi:carbamoylphosphate synthase large subunit